MSDAKPDHDALVAEAINQAGWRSGSACARDQIHRLHPFMPRAAIARIEADPNGIWVPFVASQACDLVCESLDKEPAAEFILGRAAANEKPDIALRKSWRRLQLRHPTGFADFYVHDRWFVQRELLLELTPDVNLALEWGHGIDLAKWIGGRYSRYPLPNTLAERMPLSADKPRRWLKTLTDDIDEIRIQVTPPDLELGDREKYNVVMYIIQTPRWLTTEASKKAFDSLLKWLAGLNGVSVQPRPVTSDKFSYALFKDTHHLDLDGITFGHLSGPKGGTGVNE